MSLITQYSRISHHTITSGTYSVPTQEDFTLSGTGSWTPQDLCRSEIGVNQSDDSVSIRISNSIYDILTENSVGEVLKYESNKISLNADTGLFVSTSGSTFSLYTKNLGTASGFETVKFDVKGYDNNISTYYQFSFYRSYKNISGVVTLVGTQSNIHSVSDFGTFSYKLEIVDNNNLRLNVNSIDSRTFSWFYNVQYS
jgi:hypothetical protein